MVTTLPAAAAAAPDLLYERLSAERRPGLALFQTGDGEGGSSGRRSVVTCRSLLRLELRADAAEFRLLDPAAAPLLPLLAQRLPGTAVGTDGAVVALPHARLAEGSPDDEVLQAGSVLDAVRVLAGAVADAQPGASLPAGVFGAFGYELIDRFELLGPRAPDPLHEPDASLVLATDLAVFDHRAGTVQVVTRALPWELASAARERMAQLLHALRPGPVAVPATTIAVLAPAAAEPGFLAGVRTLQQHIAAGDVFQAVLSRSVALAARAPALQVYRALAAASPSPYQFLLDLGDGELLGASPETFVRVGGGSIELRPIAGTAPRGLAADGRLDPDLDQRLALGLLLDPKEQAEHAMLLDLARNDVARVAVPGTLRVVRQFVLEKFARVQHLSSCVRGRLRAEVDALRAWRGVANMGTLTGAPKVRAMQLIRALEPTARGFYGGAVGWVLQDGSMDTAIIIRSLRHQDGVYHARAGAGVVWASDPEREFLETEQKLRSGREAVAAAAGAEVSA
ncbi:MAG TPA: anthranilate synthase component I family protein [Planctomycetota bacterium]|nr:anthranilate synthase component I family protein [Planctomycetota bacterium]